MAKLLSKILPTDIANHIYEIAIVDFMQQKISIYTYNLYLIIEKNLNIKTYNNSFAYYLIILLPDINKVINLLISINKKYITPYIKFGVDYDKDLKSIIIEWYNQINKIFSNKLLETPHLECNPYFLLIKEKLVLLNSLIR